jgi:hypothetical protein
MEDKKRKTLSPWVWIAIAFFGLFLFWLLPNLIAFIKLLAFLGGIGEGTADAIFPLRKN